MGSLTWNRRKATDAFGRENATTEHFTTYGGREYALRKSDDLFFFYLDGKISANRIHFSTLRDGKAAIEKVTVK